MSENIIKTTKNNENSMKKSTFLTFSFLIFFYYISIRLNLIHVPLDRDEGILAYMGQAILDGFLPYRDYFDQKPPALFYLNAIMMAFSEPTAQSIHTFLHIYNLIIAVVVFFIGKNLFNSQKAGLFMAFLYSAIGASQNIQGFTASTESFLMLPFMASILLTILYVKEKKTYYIILSGILGALACWTKQTAFIGMLFWFVYLFYLSNQHNFKFKLLKDKKTLFTALKPNLLWLSGGLFCSFIIIIYFAIHGIASEMFFWSFKRNLIYAADNTMASNAIWLKVLMQIIKTQPTIILIITAAIFISVKSKSPTGISLTIFFVFQLFTTKLGPTNYHYMTMLIPSTVLLGGFLFSTTYKISSEIKLKKYLPYLLIILVLSDTALNNNYYFTNSPSTNINIVAGNAPYPESIKIAKYIRENTTKDDSVFVLGSGTQILLMSDRKSANPFLHPIAFFKSTYPDYKKNQEIAWQQLKTEKPKYIIIEDNYWSMRWDNIAETTLIDNIVKLINDEYEVDKIFLIHKEYKSMIFRDTMEKIDSPLKRGPYPIVLLKRKD